MKKIETSGQHSLIQFNRKWSKERKKSEIEGNEGIERRKKRKNADVRYWKICIKKL